MKLKERNKDEGLTIPNFKTYYKATVIKTVLRWQKNRINGTEESPGIDQHEYSQLIFDTQANATQWIKDSYLSMMLKLDSHVQKEESEPGQKLDTFSQILTHIGSEI